MKVVGIKQGKKTHGFSPYWPRFDKFPHILILGKNHAPFDLVVAIVAGWVHLINYDAYLHDDQHNICRMPQYTIGDKFKTKT